MKKLDLLYFGDLELNLQDLLRYVCKAEPSLMHYWKVILEPN